MRVRKSLRRGNLIAGLVVGIVLLSIAPFSLHAQPQQEQYFSETGHTVRGEFLDFFNTHGGLRIFGFPITDEFPLDGLTVQYFQRARMELHPENPADQRVKLGSLGEELGKRTPAQPATGADTYRQRFFPETGHTAIDALLSFFDRYGGAEIFGYPISEYGLENGTGRIVQYFQRAKMEWYPELAPEQRVQLADLGSIQFDLLAEQGKVDPALKKPAAAPNTISDVPLSLQVSATTKYPVMALSGNQTVFVYVMDQKNMPVKDAEVTFTVRDAAGSQSYVMPHTDANGFTSYRFDSSTSRPAQVAFIVVNARASGVIGSDRTTFFTWF